MKSIFEVTALLGGIGLEPVSVLCSGEQEY